jgi:uncharacterized protein YggE
MRALCTVAAVLAVVLLSACGSDGDEGDRASPASEDAGQASDGPYQVSHTTVQGSTAGLALANAAPGVTVVGLGEATAQPDKATVYLSIGPEYQMSSGEALEIIPIEDVQPVLDAIKANGVAEADIKVDRLTASMYSGESGAAIWFPWDKPAEVEGLLDAVQEAASGVRGLTVQAVNVQFGLEDCPSVEKEAWEEALADARSRAEMVVELAGGSVGDLAGISEAVAPVSLYGSPMVGGCAALETPMLGMGYSFNSATLDTPSEVTVSVAVYATFEMK